MDTATKLRWLGKLSWLSPVRVLRLKSHVLYHAFDKDITAASAKKDWNEVAAIEQNRHWELSEYDGQITSIRHRRLRVEASRYFIYIPDLVWETDDWGSRYLSPESASRLYTTVLDLRAKS